MQKSLHFSTYVTTKAWKREKAATTKTQDLQCGGQLRWDGNNVSFCVPPTIDIMKTNKGPLKSPIKMLQEMQKKILIFSKIVGF